MTKPMQSRHKQTARDKSGSGRRDRRRAETRELLYRAAMQLFAERGFFETTTEAITRAADVGQGTFFNYFPTKPQVLTVLAEKQIEKINAAYEQAKAGTHSTHDLLHDLIHAIAQEPGRSAALARSLLTALVSSDEVRAFVGPTLMEARKKLAAIVRLGQQSGEIRLDRKPQAVALAFQRAAMGTLLLWSMYPKGNLRSWLDESFADFWAAAGVPEGQSQ